MAKKIEIEIGIDDVEFIMGEGYETGFKIMVNSVWCSNCKNHYKGSIVNYKIFLNHLGDIILRGQCNTCKEDVGRYIETGENKDNLERAMHLREIKLNLLKNYKK